MNEIGRIVRPVNATMVEKWKGDIRTGKAPKRELGQLHIWLGEYALAHNEDPMGAIWQFKTAQKTLQRKDHLYGLAAYDTAMSLFFAGAYGESKVAFTTLQNVKTAFTGYDRRQNALWLKHASACAGYHGQHSAIGIPEPPRLDPLCAVAAIAASSRALGLPFDKKTILKACRMTGEGSNLADVVAAGPKLGLHIYPVSATEQGLQELPKPLVAYVEHDHFVSVTRADAKGVSYLCERELADEVQKDVPEQTKFQKWVGPLNDYQLAGGGIAVSMPVAVGAVLALPEEGVASVGAAIWKGRALAGRVAAPIGRGAASYGRAVYRSVGRAIANGAPRALAHVHF